MSFTANQGLVWHPYNFGVPSTFTKTGTSANVICKNAEHYTRLPKIAILYLNSVCHFTVTHWSEINPDGPPRMGKQPTGSGGEPSSPNCETSAEVRFVNFY